jgi:hypothetical protein
MSTTFRFGGDSSWALPRIPLEDLIDLRPAAFIPLFLTTENNKRPPATTPANKALLMSAYKAAVDKAERESRLPRGRSAKDLMDSVGLFYE